MSDYKISLWSFNLSRAPGSVEDLAVMIEEGIIKASSDGAKLLVLPEYVGETCLAFKPDGLAPNQEMAYLADVGEKLFPLLKPLAARYSVSVLAGSWPVKSGDGFTNTAVLFATDGRTLLQDKLSLTPFEQDSEVWQLTPGTELRPFELDGLKMAVLICLDVEMPALSSLLAEEKIDLLLVPSMTEKLSGYHRVFDCAKARAVELMCAVAVCGVVGRSKGTTQNETNVSGAALYLPCEEEFGFTGIGASVPATGGTAGEEPFLSVNVPIDAIRHLRAGDAEVWPGAWSAAHVSIKRH